MKSVENILKIAHQYKKKLNNHFYASMALDKPLDKLTKHERNALFFLCIETPMELCKFFNIPFNTMENIINHPVYTQYTIPKKKGGERIIFAPNKPLKNIQQQLNYYLQAYYLWIKPSEVHGFVVNPHYLGKHCNIVENAKVHTRKKYLLNIDLKDFFPSITARRVKDIFSSHYLNFNEQLATALTLLCTYQGKLTIGAPTSPVISNYICYQLDTDLKKISKTNSWSYTRYADDLTFSSDQAISSDHILDIILIIQQHHFEINTKKLRLKTANQKQTVTGLTVNEKVNVDRKLIKKIRAMLHDLTNNGLEIATKKNFNLSNDIDEKYQSKFIHRLEGYINFVGQVRGINDALYIKQKKALVSYKNV